MQIRDLGVVATLLTILHAAAAAAPTVQAAGAGTPLQASGERPQLSQQTPPQMATFGLCSAAQNADDFASSAVPVVETRCEYTQTFTATATQPSHGSSCGGYTVALGPMGDFRRGYRRYTWSAAPVPKPTTAAACTATRMAVVAWGYRCDNEACSTGGWERVGIGQKAGVWNASAQSCQLGMNYAKADRDYKTLNLDVIVEKTVNGSPVRQRATATLGGARGNGKCFAADAPPR